LKNRGKYSVINLSSGRTGDRFRPGSVECIFRIAFRDVQTGFCFCFCKHDLPPMYYKIIDLLKKVNTQIFTPRPPRNIFSYNMNGLRSILSTGTGSTGRVLRAVGRFCVFLCAAGLVYAADGDDGVDIGASGRSVYGDMAAEALVSPRSAALSASDLAVNGAGPIASNPSLAARCAAPEITAAYSSYYGDAFSASALNYTGGVGKSGGISVTAAYLLIPGIEDTRGVDVGALDDGDIKSFSAYDLWLRAGYGHGFETEVADLYAGAAATFRRRGIGDVSAYGIGADIGAVAFFKKPSVYAALLWENVRYSAVKWKNYTEEVPQHLRVSLAFERTDPYIYGRIALFYTSPDLLFNEGINAQGDVGDREESRSPAVRTLSDGAGILLSAGRYGVEYTIMNTLALRMGLDNNGYSMGAGLNLFDNRAGADVCYISHELAGTVKVSVTYRWNGENIKSKS